MNLRAPHFWMLVFLLVLLRFALTSDLAVQMIYSPHDDGLYVSRAFHFLLGEGFGPYDARLLVKIPGISLWLAGMRMLGIPYLMANLLFYTAGGVYVIAALRHCGFNRLLLLGVFALYLFNPVALDHQFFRVMREPLSYSLLVMQLAAMIFILANIRERKKPVPHVLFLSIVFAFALLVREENRLLYGLLAMFFVISIWHVKSFGGLRTAFSRIGVLLIIITPLVAAYGGNTMVRSFIKQHYGLPLMYDFGAGEYPKLIAAMRSVVSKKDNRYVMITQETLRKLHTAVPMLAPVIDRLPPPGPTSYSCQRFKVCSEWTSGWELFWIKDAAFQAGLTPDLPTGQKFFRQAWMKIEQACRDGTLQCQDKGNGLLPRFELRWTRAFVHEWMGIMKMMTMPGFGLPGEPPATYPVSADYGRMYQMVTMTHHFDTQLQTSNEMVDASFQYHNPLASWRPVILDFYNHYGFILEMAGLLAFLIRIALWQAVPLSPFVWVAAVFTAFTLLRLAAISYVSVYMGGLDVRLFFSTYVVVLLLAPLLIVDSAKAIALWQENKVKELGA